VSRKEVAGDNTRHFLFLHLLHGARWGNIRERTGFDIIGSIGNNRDA
jgi:hypothetical protein